MNNNVPGFLGYRTVVYTAYTGLHYQLIYIIYTLTITTTVILFGLAFVRTLRTSYTVTLGKRSISIDRGIRVRKSPKSLDVPFADRSLFLQLSSDFVRVPSIQLILFSNALVASVTRQFDPY